MASETIYTYLDSYCERAGDPGLWAEPLNAATNLFFFAAAILGAYMLGRATLKTRAIDIWLLIASLAGIAVGSGLWHIVPRTETVMMDVIPITLFIHIYLIAALRRLLGLDWWKTAALIILYIAIGDVAAQSILPPDLLNGTIMYIPTYLTLLLLTGAVWQRDPATARSLMRVVMVWTVSLALRTVDGAICTQFPIGTHFLWHTLNAWVLWRLLGLLIARARG